MALNLTCLNSSLPLPSIPSNNSSLNGYPSHSDYNSNGKALAQRISSSLARSTFSNADIESFLNEITGDSGKTWDASSIVNFKPVKSLIIYGSITLALFLILSIVFCAMSCCNCCMRKSIDNRRQRKKGKRICQWICTISIFLIALLVIAQIIYICIQVNRTETYLKNSIDEVNHEILPKDIRDYLNKLVDQLDQLSSYTTQANSSLVQAAQVIFTNAFQNIFQDVYFLNKILQATSDSNSHMQELGIIINQSNLTAGVYLEFQELQNKITDIFNQLNNPVQELCSFANGNDSNINQMIINGLKQVDEQLDKLTNTIKDDIITQLPSEDSPMLDKNLEDQIKKYSRLIIIILTVLIVLFGFIPLAFLLFTCLCGLCRSNQESDGCSNKGICCARIFILPMFIAMIVIILVSVILYVVDLGAQSTCRTVHENQPFLISFLTDEFLGDNSSGLSFGEFDAKQTINNVIEDCKKQVHFTGRVLETYLTPINNETENAMNQLNKQIYEEFTSSITAINISSIRQDLNQLNNKMDSLNISNATNKITEIDNDLKIIEDRFNNISAGMPTLPANTTNSSIYEFRKYLNEVLNATLDRCPLPLTILYKADTLVCHDLATSINGIWLNLFVYLFLIIFGLCILGLCTCRRPKSASSKRNRPTIKDDYSSFTF